MSLFEQMISMIAGDKMQKFETVIEWVEQQGGIAGVVDKFNQQGLGDVMASWIGEGENLPLDSQQLAAIFGDANIQQLASSVKLDSQQTTSLIAKYLPKLVDGATPNGVLSDDIDLTAVGMNLLKQKLFG